MCHRVFHLMTTSMLIVDNAYCILNFTVNNSEVCHPVVCLNYKVG